MDISHALKLQLQLQTLVTNERLELEARNQTPNQVSSFAYQQTHNVKPISYSHDHWTLACNIIANEWYLTGAQQNLPSGNENIQNPELNLSSNVGDDSIDTLKSSVFSPDIDDSY